LVFLVLPEFMWNRVKQPRSPVLIWVYDWQCLAVREVTWIGYFGTLRNLHNNHLWDPIHWYPVFDSTSLCTNLRIEQCPKLVPCHQTIFCDFVICASDLWKLIEGQ
jgi:hypothetical protein